jgi:glycosyltransferase involved in cell wall biosynthesis
MSSEYHGLSVSLILCTKNEAGGIQQVIESVKPFSDEILVIDGHSMDDTAELATAAGATVYQDHGKGKGDAYQVGIQKATGDVLVFMDADGSCDPADIPVLIQPIAKDEADLVVASRHRGGSDEWGGDLHTYLRAIGSGFLSVVINHRWKSNLTDVLYGFRAVRRKAALKVPLRALDFDIEQHMIIQYLKHGYRVTEVRSHEYCRKWGASKLPTYRKAYLFFWRLFLDLISRK